MSYYVLPILGIVALAFTAICIYADYRNDYITNPFKK